MTVVSTRQGTASIASRARSRLNEVAILEELDGFDELRLMKDTEAGAPTPPCPGRLSNAGNNELPPTPNPPFFNALFVEAEADEKNFDALDDNVEPVSGHEDVDRNPLFEAIDLPLPPPRSSWTRATVSPSGSDHKQDMSKNQIPSDVESLKDQVAPVLVQPLEEELAIQSPPESRAYRTLSGLVDKMIGTNIHQRTPTESDYATPIRPKVEAKTLLVIADDSPQVVVNEATTPKITPHDQSLMQAAKNSTGRNRIGNKLRSPSPALNFPSPHSSSKPPPLILPFGSTSPLPSPQAQQSPLVRKATVVMGQKFMVESTPTPSSRTRPVRTSVKSILSSCFYPNEADKWEVSSPTSIECQQYVVTYESP